VYSLLYLVSACTDVDVKLRMIVTRRLGRVKTESYVWFIRLKKSKLIEKVNPHESIKTASAEMKPNLTSGSFYCYFVSLKRYHPHIKLYLIVLLIKGCPAFINAKSVLPQKITMAITK